MNLFWKLLGRMKRHNGVPFDTPSPRMSFYNFAHRNLPALFFADPERLIEFTVSEEGDNLKRLWTETATANPFPSSAHLSEEIRVDFSEFSDRRIVWITTPRPEQPTEPFFIALLGGEEGSGVDCHYLVLELSEAGEGIFCEWTDESKHLNYGALPDKTLATFQDAVRSGLTR